MLRQFEWGNLSAFYLLFIVFALAAGYWVLARVREHFAERFAVNIAARSRGLHWTRAGLLCLAWICAVLAFMEPRGNPRYPQSDDQDDNRTTLEENLLEEGDDAQTIKIQRKAHDVIFLVDASASMQVRDTRTGISRLDYAKELMEEVVSQLDGQTVALYAFTSETTPLVPPTLDYLFFRLQLRKMGINEGDIAGTDLLEAVASIRQRHLSTHKQKYKTVVLFSDGGDTSLESLSGEQRQRGLQAILSRIADGEEYNYRMYTIGLGSAQGAIIPDITFEGQPVRSTLDEDLLKQMASQGRGRYFRANDYSVLGIAQAIGQAIDQEERFVEDEVTLPTGVVERLSEGDGGGLIYDLYFQWPLAVALLALTIALTLPQTRRSMVALAVFVLASPLPAADIEQAELLIQAAEYAKAIEIYQEALDEERSEAQQARLLYQIGTAYLQLEQWTEAQEKYRLTMKRARDQLALKRNASMNLVVALVGEAEQLAEAQEIPSHEQALARLAAAEPEMDKAIDWTQQLQERDEDQEAAPVEELSRHLAIRTRELEKELEWLRIQAMSNAELVSLLIGHRVQQFSLSASDVHAARLEAALLEEKQTWELIADRLKEDAFGLKLLGNAETQHLASIDLYKGKRFSEAQEKQREEVYRLLAVLVHTQEKDPTEFFLTLRWKQEELEAFPLPIQEPYLTAVAKELLAAQQEMSEDEMQQDLFGVLHGELSEENAVPLRFQQLVFYQGIVRDEAASLAQMVTLLHLAERTKVLPEQEAQWGLVATLRVIGEKWQRGTKASASLQAELASARQQAEQRFTSADQIVALEKQLTELLEQWNPQAYAALLLTLLDTDYQLRLGKPSLAIPDLKDRQTKAEAAIAAHTEHAGVLEDAQIFLDEALRSSEERERMFLQGAHSEVRRAARLVTGQSPQMPVEILTLAVQQQKLALDHSTIAESLDLDRPLQNLFIHEQRRSLEAIVPFNNAAEQNRVPENAPWDKVLSLVEEGTQAAQAAGTSLGAAQVDLSKALIQQDLAYQKWKEALELLQDPPEEDEDQNQPPPDGGGGESPPDQNDEKDQQEEQEQQPPAEAPNKAFELLQKMDQEDEMLKGKKPAPKKGLKPW